MPSGAAAPESMQIFGSTNEEGHFDTSNNRQYPRWHGDGAGSDRERRLEKKRTGNASQIVLGGASWGADDALPRNLRSAEEAAASLAVLHSYKRAGQGSAGGGNPLSWSRPEGAPEPPPLRKVKDYAYHPDERAPAGRPAAEKHDANILSWDAGAEGAAAAAGPARHGRRAFGARAKGEGGETSIIGAPADPNLNFRSSRRVPVLPAEGQGLLRSTIF